MTLPKGLTDIGSDAFEFCTGFTGELNLPKSITSIGYAAFEGCKGFTGSLILPDNIEFMGTTTFADCSGLDGTLYLGYIGYIPDRAFLGIEKFDNVIIARSTIINDDSDCGKFFSSSVIYGATLYVQPALVEQYKASLTWVKFADIQPIEVTGMQFETTELRLDKCGTAQLKLIAEPYYAEVTPQYASSDESVVTVSDDGILKGVGVGRAIITATYNGLHTECNVTVNAADGNQPEPDVPAESIVMSPIIGEVGGKIRMSATVLPSNTTAPQIAWSSSAVNVAAVDEDGTVWINGTGTAVIKAACQGRETTMTVRVEAVTARGLNVFPAEAVGAVGNRFYLLALHDPENTTDKNVGWESSDPSVATVDGDGRVELKSIGRTVITATSGEHVAKCDVTVSDETTTLTAVASTGVVVNIVDGGVDVENAPERSRVIVSAVDGRVVNGMIVSSPEFHLDLAPGIYVLKIGTETAVKLLIH